MSLVNKSSDFVSNLFKDKLSYLYTYHNLTHTLAVVEASRVLGVSERLDEADMTLLLVSAFFHDTGYIYGREHHEERSVEIVKDFLKAEGESEDFINEVAKLILITKKEAIPQTQLEKIIKDADFINLIDENYCSTCELLRKEWEQTDNIVYTDEQWYSENMKFLSEFHQFYTTYAQREWSPLKHANILKLEHSLNQMSDKNSGGNLNETIQPNGTKSTEKKLKKAKLKSDRAIDTVFRVTLANHTRLSGIADSKANILLSVNAIIISIALSTIIPKLDNPKNAHLIIPTFVMLISSVVTIISAILATRPKVTKGVFSRQDIKDKKVNLLFFGNFYKMPLEEYKWAMQEMLKDTEYMYATMTQDLYYLGLVLERKYRMLRVSYNFFMIGIITTVLVFVLAFKGVI